MSATTTSMAKERLHRLHAQFTARQPIDRAEMAAALVELIENHETLAYEVEATLSGAKSRLAEGNPEAAFHLLQTWKDAPPRLPATRPDSQHMRQALELGEQLREGEEVPPRVIGEFMERVMKDSDSDQEHAIKTLVAARYLLKRGMHEEAGETIDSWLAIQHRPLSIVGLDQEAPSEAVESTPGMSPGRR